VRATLCSNLVIAANQAALIANVIPDRRCLGSPFEKRQGSDLDFHRTISIVSPANSYGDLRDVTRLREPVKSAAGSTKAAHSPIPAFQFIADFAVKGTKVTPGRCTPRLTDRRHHQALFLTFARRRDAQVVGIP